MAGKKIKQYIVTRFNLGIYRRDSKNPGFSEQWMRKRLEIFGKYCAPSIMAQDARDFRWIILIDSLTDASDIRTIEESASETPHSLVLTEWPDRRWKEGESVCDSWKERFVGICAEDGCDVAAMTRLDNDDCLERSYMGAIRDQLGQVDGRFVIDFHLGYIHDSVTGRTVLVRHGRGTPFLTLVEPVSDDMQTVYVACHDKVYKSNMKFDGSDKPMWMVVVHDSNQNNRIFEDMVVKDVDYDGIRGRFGL